FRLLLAERLQRTVVRVVLEQPVGRLVAELLRGIGLDARLAVVAVVRDRRDKGIAAGRAGEQLGRLAYEPGHVAGGVDDRVPGAALEHGEAAVAVTVELLDLGKRVGVGVAAVERRPLVALCEGCLDHGVAEKLRAADQQELHDTFQTYRGVGVSDAPTKQSRSASASNSPRSAGEGSKWTSIPASMSTKAKRPSCSRLVTRQEAAPLPVASTPSRWA